MKNLKKMLAIAVVFAMLITIGCAPQRKWCKANPKTCAAVVVVGGVAVGVGVATIKNSGGGGSNNDIKHKPGGAN